LGLRGSCFGRLVEQAKMEDAAGDLTGMVGKGSAESDDRAVIGAES